MSEAQKNAIREADNYLKAAGLKTYSELQAVASTEAMLDAARAVAVPGALRAAWSRMLTAAQAKTQEK